MEKVVIVAVILALVIVVFLLCTGKNVKSPDKNRMTDENDPMSVKRNSNTEKELSTGFLPVLIIDQTTAKGMVVESFDIASIPEEGITISRPGAKIGDIILSPKCKEATTVGTEGLIIGKDEKGIFGKLYENGRKKNKLFLFDRETKEFTETEQFDIEDGTVICMGSQMLKFRIPALPKAPVFFDSAETYSDISYSDIQKNIPVPISDNNIEKTEKDIFFEKIKVHTVTNEPKEIKPEEKKESAETKQNAPSGFTFETSIDTNGRFVIKKDR